MHAYAQHMFVSREQVYYESVSDHTSSEGDQLFVALLLQLLSVSYDALESFRTKHRVVVCSVLYILSTQTPTRSTRTGIASPSTSHVSFARIQAKLQNAARTSVQIVDSSSALR